MTHAVRLHARSIVAIALASSVGVMAFGWPLLSSPGSTAMAHAADAPWVFAALLPLLLAVVLAELADGGMNAKSIAMLGVLSAVVCILRPLGAGTIGIEPIWFVLVLAGRSLGPGFGFCLGAISMGASALLTGGIGPWLPFQMIAAAWVGLGAGLIRGPRDGSWREVAVTATYGAVAALVFGLLMNLWIWPFTGGLANSIAFDPGAGLALNLQHWIAFSLATSLAFDLPRAILTVVLISLLGKPTLAVLRRASRRAVFDAGNNQPKDVVRV